MRFMSSMTGGGGTFYKNVKDKAYVVDKEFMGKEFLVKDSLANLQWKMESETRVIGGYTCYKATAVKAASKTDFRNFRPKKEEEVKKNQTNREKQRKPILWMLSSCQKKSQLRLGIHLKYLLIKGQKDIGDCQV